IHHGLFCVGCCWTLMLLMFGVGVGNLGWMLVLGAVMGVEKNMTWGRRLSAPLGVVLIVCGVALLVDILPGPQTGLGLWQWIHKTLSCRTWSRKVVSIRRSSSSRFGTTASCWRRSATIAHPLACTTR